MATFHAVVRLVPMKRQYIRLRERQETQAAKYSDRFRE